MKVHDRIWGTWQKEMKRWFPMFCSGLVLWFVLSLSERHSCNKCQFSWCPKLPFFERALKVSAVSLAWPVFSGNKVVTSSYFQPYKFCSVKCDQNVLCLCFCSTWKVLCFILQICPSNFSQCSRSCGVVSFLVISNVQFLLPSNKCALQCVKFGERTIVLNKFSSGRLARFSSSEHDDQQCQKVTIWASRFVLLYLCGKCTKVLLFSLLHIVAGTPTDKIFPPPFLSANSRM